MAKGAGAAKYRSERRNRRSVVQKKVQRRERATAQVSRGRYRALMADAAMRSLALHVPGRGEIKDFGALAKKDSAEAIRVLREATERVFAEEGGKEATEEALQAFRGKLTEEEKRTHDALMDRLVSDPNDGGALSKLYNFYVERSAR